MDIEMLVSTMNQTNYDLLKRMNIKNKAVVINQFTNDKSKPPKKIDNETLKFISVYEKGLSKSRNTAIENADNSIGIICDDDLYYYDDVKDRVRTAYQKNKDADIIIFCYDTDGRHKKNFGGEAKRLGYLGTMKVSSVQVTFKIKSIKEKDIRFNELFGTGSSYYQCGEENIFLFECLKKGLKIYFEPISILSIDDNDESTWFNGFDDKSFFDRGAVFTAMSSRFYHFLIWQFAIRKYKIYRHDIGFIGAIKNMYRGHKDYLNMTNQ
ncbi:glycosyltransferase family 2 protein [Priestia sp. Y58]|uniref:glycosyltransferase family 2 protein n=1 Tax=Priestia sp. Y58 TaxID=2922804 RepID=UPI002405B87C|nr:glycosyltransferase family 2 protein [Priestia sp. Y58]MDG0030618.1 glycosyltransferase family 2 protein [Priestia sp. Y58]